MEWPRNAKYPSAGTVSDYKFHLKPQVVPASHSWIPGGTAYADAASYGHAAPSRVVKPFGYPIAAYERIFYTYGPLFGLIMAMGAWGVWRRRASALPWVTAVVLLVFPVAVADFDYRYLLPVLPFAGLAAALAFAPAAEPGECPEVPDQRVESAGRIADVRVELTVRSREACAVNESAVLLAGDLAWPVTVLIIATLLLVTQRESLSRLIDRIKSLKYPGGEAELGMVAESGVAVISTAVESLSRDVTVDLDRGKRPADGEQIEPIQNREPIGDVEPLRGEEVTSLVLLRANAAIVLEGLAYPPPPGGFGSVSTTLEVLRRRGVLDDKQTTSLAQLIDLADEASRGAVVPRRIGQAVQNSGTAIVRQLNKLRAVAGPKFEDHVLAVLRQRLPAGWTLDIDRAVPRDAVPGDGPVPGGLPHARVDALVTSGDRSVVVEVRARLQPGQDDQIEAVRDLLAALPPQLPVLLVMLGERLTDREMRWMCAGHEGPVELLLWDRDSGELIVTLRELLDRARSELMTGLPTQRTVG